MGWSHLIGENAYFQGALVSWYASANITPPFALGQIRSNSGVASEIIEL